MSLSDEEALEVVRFILKWDGPVGGRQSHVHEVSRFCRLQILQYNEGDLEALKRNGLGFNGKEFAAALENAKAVATAFDGVCDAIAWAVEEKQELTDDARLFMAGVIRGTIQRPKKGQGRGKHGNMPRYQKMIFALLALRLKGINPTRNDETERWCGCDFVATVLQEMGVKKGATAGSVKKVWEKRGNALYGPSSYAMASKVAALSPPGEPLPVGKK